MTSIMVIFIFLSLVFVKYKINEHKNALTNVALEIQMTKPVKNVDKLPELPNC